MHVLSRVHDGILHAREAARLRGLSLRHLRRLLARLRQHRPGALAPGTAPAAPERHLRADFD